MFILSEKTCFDSNTGNTGDRVK